jgi:PGF-pre-PGF domain-containing protein
MKNKVVVYSLMFIVFAFFVNGAISILNISPSNNYYANNQTPTFSFDIYGNTSTNNCTLYIDELPYGTNESIVNGTVVMVANDTLSEAAHTWYVNCSDEYGMNTTGPRTINIDVTAPTVINVSVSDSLITNSDTGYFYVDILFNESMNTAILPNITFDPSLLGALNPCSASWISTNRTLIYNCTIVDINATVIDVNINISLARDLASNMMTNNVSHSMFDIDQQEPTVTIDYPLNGTYYTVSLLDLNFTATDATVCWYELDGNYTSLPGCADSNLSGLSEGQHSLTVRVNDTVNNTATDTITFIVDTILPAVTSILSPVPSEGYNLSNGNSLYVSILANENLSVANISFDGGVAEQMINSTTLDSWNISRSELVLGQHNYTITIRDLAYNMNTTLTYNFSVVDLTPPNITLNYPDNGSFSNNVLGNLSFNFTTYDDNATTLSCDLYFDGVLNQSNASILEGVETEFIVFYVMNGTHSWYLNCSDGYTPVVSDTRYLTLDNSTPTVSISMSSNQLLGSSSLPYLVSGTASGGASAIDTLTLFVNSVGYNISNITGNNWNFTWTPSEGTYNLTAEVCNLAATCTNSTTISNITVDLTAANTTNNANIVNWNTFFIITLTPNETVAYTSYKVGALPWQNGTIINITGALNFSSGNIFILYYSVDSVGNAESQKNVTVKYDITAPISIITGFMENGSSYIFNAWSSDTALVNLSGNDTHSGYNRTVYCLDTTNTCSNFSVWNSTLNITTPGVTYIRYRSVDNLENTEAVRISRVMIIQNNTIYINESLNVTENETNIIVPEDNNNSNIYVPPNVNATLDFSEMINISMNDTHNVTLNGSINTTVNTTLIVKLDMPENITLSGNSSWLGNFNLPKLMPKESITITIPGYIVAKDIVVEIGADNVPILMDRAIRINLSGKGLSGIHLWYGSSEVIATCVNDTQEWADSNLSNDITGHCKIIPVNSTDLIIWTKHLSTFTTYTQTAEDTSGGGGDGSSSSSYVPSTNTTLNSTANPSVVYSYLLLANGTRIINVTHSQIPLYGIALTTNANVSDARLKIILISNPPLAQAETVYKYFQIDHETINDSIISGVKLQFKVSKSWLNENKIEKNQVVLYRYINGWNMLTTAVLKEDADSVYYESSSPGLSVFAIATRPKPPVTVTEPTAEDATANLTAGNETTPDVQEGQKSNPFVISVLVIIFIVVLLYIFYAMKNRKEDNIDKK